MRDAQALRCVNYIRNEVVVETALKRELPVIGTS